MEKLPRCFDDAAGRGEGAPQAAPVKRFAAPR